MPLTSTRLPPLVRAKGQSDIKKYFRKMTAKQMKAVLADPDLPEADDEVFQPTADVMGSTGTWDISNGLINSYPGFAGQCGDRVDVDVSIIQPVLDNLYLLSGSNKESYEYLLGYFADMVQNPASPKRLVLIFFSVQGTGKDLTIGKCIGKMMVGEHMYKAFGTISQMLHTHATPELKDKLFVVVSEGGEAEMKSGIHKVKDLIDSDTLRVNQKFEPIYTRSNFMRMAIFSQAECFPGIDEGDRR